MKIDIRTLMFLAWLASPTCANTSSATTTRYWDCSGGSCGCAYLPPQLGGNQATPAHCYSNALFAAPAGNKHGAAFYGGAAISEALGGGYWLPEGCGKCWKVIGRSNIPGHDTSTETTLVLKATNFCPPGNPACSGGRAHFDIAAPGFDFTAASLSNSCTLVEPKEVDGFRSCGRWMIDSQDPSQNCNCDAFGNSVLRDGCENFQGLYWNNPTVTYEEINCPSELLQSPCWDENGSSYPWPDAPALCLDPLAGSAVPVPAPTSASPTPFPTLTSTPGPTTLPTMRPPLNSSKTPTMESPMPQPTNAPVAEPAGSLPTEATPAPTPELVTKAPIEIPSTSAPNSGCCSQDFRLCLSDGSWCNDISKCGADNNCLENVWLPNGEPLSCIGRWGGGCNSNDDCCPGLGCDTSNPYWKSCVLVS